MKNPYNVFVLLISLTLVACTAGIKKPPSAASFPIGLPFERGLMAFVRGELEEAEQQMYMALQRNAYDVRARELLAIIDNESDITSPEELPYLALDRKVKHPEDYLALVAGRNPQLRQAMFVVTERHAKLRLANLDIGPELNVLARFYPEAIFAAVTQTLNKLIQRPSKLQKAEFEILAALAEYANIKNKIMGEAIDNYFDYLSAQQQLNFLQAELNVHNQHIKVLKILTVKNQKGLATLSKAESKRDKTQQLLLKADGLLNLSLLKLSDLAQIDAQYIEHLAVEKLYFGELYPLDKEELDDLAVQAAQAYSNAEKSNKMLTLLSLPKVSLFASYGNALNPDNVNFVQGPASGLRIQMPLLIWPLQKANMAKHSSLIAQLEMQVEFLLAKARYQALFTYENYRLETQNLALLRQSLHDNQQALQRQNLQKQEGQDLLHSVHMEAYMRYYHSHYLYNMAQYKQQKIAFRWLRSLGAITEQLEFYPAAPQQLSSCQSENKYLQAYPYAMWVRGIEPLLQDTAQQQRVINIAQAQGINTLFIWIDGSLITQYPKQYAQFIQMAHQANITVQAYSTQENWLAPVLNGDLADSLINFNAALSDTQRFDGVRVQLSTELLPLIDTQKSLGDLLEALSKSKHKKLLHIGVDIPIFPPFNKYLLTIKPLLPLIDNVAIMVNDKTNNAQLSLAFKHYQDITQNSTPYWVGVDLKAIHHAGRSLIPKMEQLDLRVQALCQLIEQEDYLKGFAFHTFVAYKNILINQPQ